MQIRKIVSVLAVVLLVAGGVWYIVVVVPRNAPWEESGTVVVVTRAMPEPSQTVSTILGFGLADMRLVEGEDTVRLTLTTERILLDAQDTRPHEILRTEVHAGSYSGLAFSIKSPEMRNDAEMDTPQEYPLLVTEDVFLEVPFSLEAGQTIVIMLGFETHKAIRLRETSVVFLPVIHTEVRSGATVEAGEGSSSTVRDGIIVHNVLFGTDWDGTIRRNFRAGAEPVMNIQEDSSVPPVEEVLEKALEETASTSIATSSDEIR